VTGEQVTRRDVTGRRSFALEVPRAGSGRGAAPLGAQAWPAWLRVLTAPFVAAAVAAAGIVYLILLPVCGIASIAEGVLRSGWRMLRALPRGKAAHAADRI
jgi:hypothetical protein